MVKERIIKFIFKNFINIFLFTLSALAFIILNSSNFKHND